MHGISRSKTIPIHHAFDYAERGLNMYGGTSVLDTRSDVVGGTLYNEERGYADQLLFPDPDTAFLDPACTIPTLSIICDVIQPGSMERYSRDPRFVAKKAEAFLTESGIATTAYFGPEVEFYIFNSIRFGQDARSRRR